MLRGLPGRKKLAQLEVEISRLFREVTGELVLSGEEKEWCHGISLG